MAAQETNILLSVIICSYNRETYIVEALTSLYLQTIPKDQFEVLVIDNNSTDNTSGVCSDFILTRREANNFHYFLEARQGASFARNTGAAHAKGSLLVFMDDDAIANDDFLERIKLFFEQHPRAGGLGGRIIPRYIPEKPIWMSHYVSSLVGNFDYSQMVEEFSPQRYPLESNMVVRREDFNLVGGFNTDLPGVKGTLRIGGEGKEFFFKLKGIGKSIWYDPSVRVEHIVEVKKLTREYLYRVASGIGRGESVRTKAKSQWAYYKKIIEYLYKLAGSIVLGLLYLLKGMPSRSMVVIRFRIDAIRGLTDNKR